MTSSGSLNFFASKNALSVKEGDSNGKKIYTGRAAAQGNEGGRVMNKPSVNILDLLISLYADQMGVEIKYEVKEVA